ncbi:ribosomal L7Ae/L30e/S12e/Gadd45 family protein [Lactobacillus hamsteri]|uniref:Ribosomal protein L7 L12 n=1 Tax=Lactobacillus hamsteri DSM 5661 = JCM 6256 TaxID=1423754 RepID=A0A0R1YB18_9LACO|nr:ribosomal L7Ae/L30e/S12e/Gadd45 family protein [Lactobacillus hamsteri]KRM36971.1 ribosomal protein L7 L12 [Lactobacillus hamsteri DSM 5661 = JCM 6256]
MQNKQKALNLLGLAMRAGKIVSGTETVISALNKGQVKVIILASDLHENTSEKVIRAAKKVNVSIIDLFSSEELAHAIGKKRKVMGLTDVGFYKALTKKINEGV